ncbi:MAG TPA: NAD(P)H-binding protein [Mycobacteriales bacterium]|nr:NAD(P)H-binding protein [Mycobacteriales bacterium]
MAEVLVTGATGSLGSVLVPALTGRGHTVRAMSRRPGEGRVVADLSTGEGLSEALAGVSVVVHAAKDLTNYRTGSSADADYLRPFLARAAEAGVEHFLYVSIVGVDRNPYPFYQVKLACERLIARSGLNYSVVRASQFPQLVLSTLQRGLRGPLCLVPLGFSAEPVAVEDVAVHIADRLEAGPSGAVTEFAGPERLTSSVVARIWLEESGERRIVVPVPVRGRVARAFRMQSNIADARAPRGTRTWREYVQDYVSQHAGK